MKFLPLAVILLLGACAHDLALMKRDETLHAYAAAIRWGAFDEANRYRSSPAYRRPIADNLRDIKVSGYHVLSQSADKERMTVEQTVELHYYRQGDLVEKKVVDPQLWHYDDITGQWQIDTPLPRFP
ncbi:hypothetical protein [Methylotetracoccus oryzae]|uniref:hypothetical protein n=1 Tax=Methylotetracoccus oryzae TaxID=1919059 RepID=UPI0011186A39|nr:hypothetical protein [Methylotetracoccus oryzae]